MSDDSAILDVLTAVPFLDGDMGYPFIPPGPGKRFTTVANHLELEDSGAAKLLAALRAAGYDVAPADTIRLGQAVEAAFVDPDEDDKVLVAMPGGGIHSTRVASVLLEVLHERAGVERGGQ